MQVSGGKEYLRGCAHGLFGGAGEIAEASNSICCVKLSTKHQKPPVLHIGTARRQGHCGKEEGMHNLTYEYTRYACQSVYSVVSVPDPKSSSFSLGPRPKVN